MRRDRIRLPYWTARPAFGVAVLLLLAVALIVHGEPQPSLRPSGRSVVVAPASATSLALPATLLIRDAAVLRRAGSQLRRVGLPAGVVPVSLLTSNDYSVVLAVAAGRQHAYGVTASLQVRDLGLADGVIASSYPGASVVVERALSEPGRIGTSITPATPSRVASTPRAAPSLLPGSDSSDLASSAGERSTGPSSRSPIAAATLPQVRSYVAQRFDNLGHPLGVPIFLAAGTRVAVDAGIGLLAWKPVGVLVDRGQVAESLSGTAMLVRPDSSVRVIGAVHPLAATATQLLVWDIAHGQFGLMPLTWVTSDSTRLPAASTSASASVSEALAADEPSTAVPGDPDSSTPTPSASPSTVAGVRWFMPTRGFVVTGPATFSSDGSAFAAYGQVGNRRRLIVGEVKDVGSDQVSVLALNQPSLTMLSGSAGASQSAVLRLSGTTSGSAGESAAGGLPASSVSVSVSGSARRSDLPSATSNGSEPGFDAEGFPTLAPATPFWLGKLVVAIATDGTVVGYLPGGSVASVIEVDGAGITSLATAP